MMFFCFFNKIIFNLIFRMLKVDKSHCKLGASGGNILHVETEDRRKCLKLSLRRNYIADAETMLQDFSSLTWLCLSANALTSIPRALEDLLNLKHLFISNNKIQLIENLDNCINLETIDVRHNRLQELTGVAHLTKLTSLSVSGNIISKVGPHNISSDKLVFLGLYGNQISDFEEIKSIVKNMNNLSKLFIGSNPFCDNLPLKPSFNVTVCSKDHSQTNGIKRMKCNGDSLNLSEMLALLKCLCPSLVNIDNNIID